MKFDKDHMPGGIPRIGDLLNIENEHLKKEILDKNLSSDERLKKLEIIKKNEKQIPYRNLID